MRILPLIFARIALAALLVFLAGGFGTCGANQPAATSPAASAAVAPASARPANDQGPGNTVVARRNADQPGQNVSADSGKPVEESSPQIVLAETATGIVLFDSGLSLPRPVTFAQGSWKDIVEADLPMLQDLSRLLREHPSVKVMILGHRSSEETGLVAGADFSLKRAQTVRDFLMRSGVQAAHSNPFTSWMSAP